VHGVDRLTPKTNVLAALNPRLRKFIGFSLLRFVVAGLSASAESVGALDSGPSLFHLKTHLRK
jgi:hypothetical protein